MHPKCKKTNGHLSMCKPLSDTVVRYHAGSGSARGLFLCTLHFFQGPWYGKQSNQFVVVKDGAFQKKGVAMNFCPFCGADHKPEQSATYPKVKPNA